MKQKPRRMTDRRELTLLCRQSAYTDALMLCEGIANRPVGGIRTGALMCAKAILESRDSESEHTGLRRAMGWVKSPHVRRDVRRGR